MTVLRPGQRLGGRYKIIRPLGGGGFGQTYKAEDEQRPDNPTCVVKQLKPQSTAPENLRLAERLFETEAKTLYKLGEHPQIPRLFDHFEENQEFYLVMEFIDGHDLTAELTPGQPLNQSDTIDLLRDILEVLAFVHQQKVIHRDLKPQNIMRQDNDDGKQDRGKIVLIDFGAVKEITSQTANSQEQVTPTARIGTRGYMPPEQTQGIPKLCSDVYAVGIIGIQALTGINPNPRCGALPINPQGNIIWRDRANVSSNFAKILDKMVSFHFNERYQSAAEALQALTDLTKKSRPWAAIIGLPIAAAVAIVIGLNVSKFIPPRPIAQNFLTYEDPEYGFSIAYPENWEEKEKKDAITRTVVVLESPKENDSDKFQEQLRVRIKDRSANSLTLDDYTKSSLNKIKRSRTIVDSGSTNLANSPAYRVVYRGQDEEYSLQWLEVWTIIGDRIYIITYEAEADKYSDFLSTAEEMIDSFEISSPLAL